MSSCKIPLSNKSSDYVLKEAPERNILKCRACSLHLSAAASKPSNGIEISRSRRASHQSAMISHPNFINSVCSLQLLRPLAKLRCLLIIRQLLDHQHLKQGSIEMFG